MAEAPLKVLVVDDEPLARRSLRILLSEAPAVEVVGEAGNGRDAVDAVRRLAPDLVFLDVQMPEMDGFGVLRSLEAHEMPTVVFVTAYDEHAVRAFDVHAADYLLKPFDDDRFHRALHRARARVGDRRARELAARLAHLLASAGVDAGLATPASPAPPPADRAPSMDRQPAADSGVDAGRSAFSEVRAELADRIVLKANGRVTFLAVESIDWIEAADYVVRLHAGGAVHTLREPLADLEKRLDPRRFFRIHRSTIVNLDRVKELQPLFYGEYVVILRDGQKLRLSRSRREGLEALLGTRL